MKNRISVLFSVILGALLITSCSNVLQPNKKVADIEVKASLSGTMARGAVSREDDTYSFIDEELSSSDYRPYTYYQIIKALMGDYNKSVDEAYDILAEKLIENSDFSTFNNHWMQIKTNFGQKSEKVYPYAKQMDLIKSYYKAAITNAYLYYSFLEEAKALSNGQPDYAALAVYAYTNPNAEEEFANLSKKLEASTTANLPDYNFDLSTVSLKLNSVPFDQEVTFTLLINYDSVTGIEPEKYEFTRFVNPGLNVFDILPNELQPTSDSGFGGDDEGDPDPDPDPVEEPDPDPVEEPDPDVVDPWEGYTTYYVSNTAAVTANGLEDDPMSLSAAFEQCKKSYKDTGTKYAIILTEDITISDTLKVPESAYVVISGNYDGSIKKISAGSDFNSNMFSIEDHANLGLSSVALDGTNLNCQLFYCSHSVNEGDLETNPLSLTGTLTMENCTVTNFAGTENAGIITMATGGEMTISGCTFENNTVRDTGAVYLISGTLILNGNLLDSTLTSINTNSFNDYVTTNSPKEPANPCEIYLKGNGYFNDTNKFLNSTLYAVHTAGYTHLELDGTYYSGQEDSSLTIYSSTDGSVAKDEECKNIITVDKDNKVEVTEGGDNDENTEDQTYEINVYTGV